MSIDKETVRHVARLARLALSEQEVAPLLEELNVILAWVEQLKEVEVKDVAPMTSGVTQKLKMRDDLVTDGGYSDDLMINAPHSEDCFFVVPKVVE